MNTPFKNQVLKKIIQAAIDIHVHIGPEIIPRKYTVSTFIKEEENNLGGAVFKNHFYPTLPFINEAKKTSLQLFGGIVLNNFIGGLNPDAVYATSLLTIEPIMVWMPTLNAENFLEKSEYEIAPEWVKSESFKGRLAKDVRGICVLKNGKVSQNAFDVLQAIKKTSSVLATGHISYEESEILVKEAIRIGINKIVITHPIYQRIAMPVSIQKKLAQLGCFIEQSYSMCSIDKISIKKIAEQIRSVGAKSVILSSDVGQLFSPSPSQALFEFGNLLIKEGFTFIELEQMLVKNPKKLLGIE